MANEITVASNMRVAKGNLNYTSSPSGFRVTMTGLGGPTPGGILVAVTGTNINLTALTTPGMCRILNLDTTNFVTLGVYDAASFYPLLEIGPGESYVFKLSRYVNEEFIGTGTNADANNLRLMADTAECLVVIEAFEK